MQYNSKMVRLGAVFGIIGLLGFIAIAVLVEQLFWQKLNLRTTEQFLTVFGASPHYQLTIGGHLLIGVCMLFQVVAFVGLYHLLSRQKPRASVTIGTVLGIIASGIAVIQMTVQGTVMARMGTAYLMAGTDTERQDLVTLYKGLRLFDQGIDLAFDLFFFSAWILLALAMLSDRRFGRVFGCLGLLLLGITVIVNAWSAPLPPSFEMSPVVSLWMLAVYVQMSRSIRSLPTSLPQA